MTFDEIAEVFGCLVIEGFVGGDEYFEVDPVFNGEPVEVVEDWGDVVSLTSVGEEAGSRVLDVLKFVE